MATTWKLSSFVSNTDVKELIPEFFYLQEFLENGESEYRDCIVHFASFVAQMMHGI